MELLEKGHVAVVTGAAQGIGYEIARVLAEQGAHVVLVDINGDAAIAAAARLADDGGGEIVGMACDVTKESDVAAVAALVSERWGRLDTWVNNAGITRDASLRNLTLADFELVTTVHLSGTWLGVRAAADLMREQGSGSIINLSSLSGKSGNKGQTNYSAAKAGIVGLTKAAAKELAHKGVRVNAIQPGLIRTPMTDAMKPEVFAAREADIPMQRAGEPAEVANVALFLASGLSSYMTGAVLEVGGGRYM
ncbi:3-oxoacyl-ACP reductase FabG [Granulicoccus phenolivorans]|uniref:3-oxoacyl-ACP reductase FabG n=1 Tax=Granulicoccus phenolivorans TaxID=266854 RepID=UPI00041974BB|nr:3-oxoacyl-ACP reductase FabG [Granulicoccus phenolivorans]